MVTTIGIFLQLPSTLVFELCLWHKLYSILNLFICVYMATAWCTDTILLEKTVKIYSGGI